MFRVGFIFLFILSNSVFAQGRGGISSCKESSKAQKDFMCGSCDRDKVSGVYGSLKDEEGNSYGEPGLLDKLMDPTLENNVSSRNAIQSAKTIEDIIAIMPDSVKKDVVVMNPSRSLQEGPRFLMKSANAEVVFSVNGHPDKSSGGGQSIEMLVWDGKTGTYQMAEIKMKNGKPSVEKNPRRCVHCHGSHPNIRPVFDPYNFWAHTVPFTRDDLIGGPDPSKWNQDTKNYLAFLDKVKDDAKKEVETGERTRYSVLSPILENNDPDNIRAFFKNSKTPVATYRIQAEAQTPNPPGSSNFDGGPAVRLFDNMYYNNHCRLNRMIADKENNPAFDQNKYAIAAVAKGCFDEGPEGIKDIQTYFPESFNNQSEKYFKGRYSVPPNAKDGAGYKALYEDTKNKQEAYYADRVGRKLWATEKMYMEDFEEEMNQRIAAETDSEKQDEIRREYEIKAYEAAKSDLRAGASHSVLEDREESLDQVAPLRYVLEASGMDTSLLSMSVDPESYTFGDFFSNIADFGFIKELNEKSCSDLKRLSVEAFNQAPDDILENYSVNATESCQNPWDTRPLTFGNEQLLEDLQVASLADARNKLRNDVSEILNTEGCAGCHAYGVKGAPPIPFSNMNALERELTNSSGEIGNLAQRVWNRVSRVDGQHGVMPLGGPPIDKEDKEKIKQYFETFDSPYARRIEVASGNIIDLNTRDGVSFSTEANTFTINPVNFLGIPESGSTGGFFGGGGLGGFPGGDQKKTFQNTMQNKEVLQNGVVGEPKITENNVDAVLQGNDGFGF